MPVYAYKGITKLGKEVKSTISSDSVSQAKIQVKSKGIMLLEIKEQAVKSNSSFLSGLTSKKVSVEELALMTRQFATLIGAKIQVVEALRALGDQVDTPMLKTVLGQVRQDVNEGSSLANSMGKHPNVFNNIYVNMVEAGEASGTLDVVLLRLAEFSESQVKLANKVKGAMTYPMLMGVMGTLGMGVIFTVVIPKMTKIFIKAKIELPTITKITVAISNFLLSYWWTLIIAAFVLYIAFMKHIKSQSGKRVWDSIVLKVPVIGKLIKMINVERLCSTLGTLLNSGVPILTALKIVKNLVPNIHLKENIEEARINVSEGGMMTTPLIESGNFPSMVTHMMSLGEQSGELEPMLDIISENYSEQVESNLAGLTALLQPIMVIFLGIAVGVIVMSVVIPMMKMGEIGR